MFFEEALASATWGPVIAVLTALALFLIAGLAQLVFSVVIGHRGRSNPDALDLRILTTARGPVVLFLLLLGVFLGYVVLSRLTHPAFEFFRGTLDWAARGWLVIVIIEVSYLVSHILQALIQWYLENIADRTTTDLDEKLLPQVRRVTPILVYAIGVLTVLDVIGISITPMIAGLGIGGLAVALAIQPTLSSFLAGTYLITEGELNEGDFIELDGGPSGFVVDVGWRSTKMRDRFNNLIMVPNSKMMDSIMINYYSQSKAMTVFLACGVSYDSDLKHVEKVSLEVAGGVVRDLDESVDDYEPLIYFTEFGDSNIDFVLLVQAHDRAGSFVVKHELIKRLHARFNDEGIEINYPVRRLVLPPVDGAGLEALAGASPRSSS